MKASKNNKEYEIHESQKKFYQDAGYDILDDKGSLISYGRGKTVPYEDYVRSCDEILSLRARVKELEAAIKTQNGEEEEPVRKEPEIRESEKKTVPKKAGN